VKVQYKSAITLNLGGLLQTTMNATISKIPDSNIATEKAKS